MSKDTGDTQKRSRFKILHILLIIFVLIFVAVGIFAYSNRENLMVVYYAYRTSKEDLQVQQEENDQRIRKVLNGLTDVQMRELTEEERKMLDAGEITEEEAIDLVTGRVAEREASLSRKESLIAQIYVLRATYTSRIESLIANAKSKYIALDESEQTTVAKFAIAEELVKQGNALEAECDGQMDMLLDNLRTELENLGEDTNTVSEIKSIYTQEKRIKKAVIIDTYYPN
ncbi:MAG: hypothetical protein IJQ50_03215 [Clostridia bacterium]|nr:hypothetical protein [Clostridia bacterium]MBR0277457.1 hypothetical protein [Clostridia bacterium]